MSLDNIRVSEDVYFTLLNQKDKVIDPVESSRSMISQFLEEERVAAANAKAIGDVEGIETHRRVISFWEKYNKKILDLVMEISTEFADVADKMYINQVKQMERQRDIDQRGR